MAGSLFHIVAEDGSFRMGSIENLGDAHEALDECFKIIYNLTGGQKDKVNESLRGVGPEINVDMQLGGEDEL